MYQSTSLNHTHGYFFQTSFDDAHCHGMQGMTNTGVPYGTSHVHYYQGVTSRDNGHVHYYNGVSAPAIYLPNGSHIHYHSGMTEVAHHHIHRYAGNDTPSY